MIRILLLYSVAIMYCMCIENSVIVKQLFNPKAAIFDRIQSQNFRSLLLSNDLAIDKTLLIKSIIEDEGKLFLIVCPSGWGKSLNLDTIKTFLHIANNEDNFTELVEMRHNHRLFARGELINFGQFSGMLKTPMLIARHKHIVDEYLGRWPVIHLDLAFSFGDANFSSMLEGIKYCVSLAFEEHHLVAKNKLLQALLSNDTDLETKNKVRKQLELFQDIIACESSINEVDLEISIAFLSRLLHEYYNKKVFLLVDEYMTPLQELLLYNGFPEPDRTNFLKFFTSFMSKSCKSNIHVEKVIVTGEFPPTEELHKQVFTQAVECSPLTGKFMQYYGFSRLELNMLFHEMNFSTDVLAQVRQRYEGYKINQKGDRVYHPWAIMKYVATQNYSDDIIDSETILDYIPNFISVTLFREKFRHLLNHENIVVIPERPYYTNDEFERQLKVYASTRDAINFGNRLTEGAFMFLYYLGYLTLSEDCPLVAKNQTYSMEFPNNDIKEFMNTHFDSHY